MIHFMEFIILYLFCILNFFLIIKKLIIFINFSGRTNPNSNDSIRTQTHNISFFYLSESMIHRIKFNKFDLNNLESSK